MNLPTIAKALAGFGGRHTVDLESMLVEYLQERNKKVNCSPAFRDRVIARWLREALEHLHANMTPREQDEIVKCVCKDLYKEDELIAADVIITAASARQVTKVSRRQQQLREVSGLSYVKQTVMQIIHEARLEGRSTIRLETEDYQEEERVGTWLKRLKYEVEKTRQGYTVRWWEESEEDE